MRVTLIALADIFQHSGEINFLTTAFQFKRAPIGTGFGAGCDENFHRCIGANDSADVASIKHGTCFAIGKAALHLKQRFAHSGDRTNNRSSFTHFAPAQAVFVKIGERKTACGLHGMGFIIKPLTRIHQSACSGAIEQARIKMRQGIMGRQAPRDCAFARGCRSINCNNHEISRIARQAFPWRGGMWGSWWRSYSHHQSSPALRSQAP